VGLLGSVFPLSFSKTQALLDQLLGVEIQGRLKVCHGSAGAAMLVPVLSGLLSSFGRPRCHC
jgi:hypothetical protein